MNKPTPGPWFTSGRAERPSESGVSIMAKVSGEEVAVAECWVRGGISLEAAQASSRLIAAAPELLEALKLVLDLIPRAHGPTVQKARAAIAKAEGKP